MNRTNDELVDEVASSAEDYIVPMKRSAAALDAMRAQLATATRDVLRVAGERDDARRERDGLLDERTLYRQERDAARAQLAKARTVTREQVKSAGDVLWPFFGDKQRALLAEALRAAGLEVENG